MRKMKLQHPLQLTAHSASLLAILLTSSVMAYASYNGSSVAGSNNCDRQLVIAARTKTDLSSLIFKDYGKTRTTLEYCQLLEDGIGKQGEDWRSRKGGSSSMVYSISQRFSDLGATNKFYYFPLDATHLKFLEGSEELVIGIDFVPLTVSMEHPTPSGNPAQVYFQGPFFKRPSNNYHGYSGGYFEYRLPVTIAQRNHIRPTGDSAGPLNGGRATGYDKIFFSIGSVQRFTRGESMTDVLDCKYESCYLADLKIDKIVINMTKVLSGHAGRAPKPMDDIVATPPANGPQLIVTTRHTQ